MLSSALKIDFLRFQQNLMDVTVLHAAFSLVFAFIFLLVCI